MRVHSLDLTNIGPFDEAHLTFPTQGQGPAVTFITGENGTGKSIVLDAIRASFGVTIGPIERPIWREGIPFAVSLRSQEGGGPVLDFAANAKISFGPPNPGFGLIPHKQDLYQLLVSRLAAVSQGTSCPNWILDYWRSGLPSDPYEIRSLITPNPRTYLSGALSGVVRNAAATESLCFFDYLRGSSDPQEKETGEALFEATRRIIELSLLDGRFIHIDRRTLTPYVEQSGHRVPLRNLSSGNAYLIQRLLGLLVKMYAVHTLRGTPAETLCETPGLLLIDEAENHLHPRWQKRLLPEILGIFPNLQIIATTHSPFILSSVANARVYVCSYRKEERTCIIEDASANFASQPVDQILISPALDHTQPFSAPITSLIEDRKTAIENGNRDEQNRIEALLLEENPDYFAYFRIDEQLRLLAGGVQ